MGARLASLYVTDLAAVCIRIGLCPLCTSGGRSWPRRLPAAANCWADLAAPCVSPVRLAARNCRWKGYLMSRLAGFYIAKAIESAAGSPTPAAASRLPPRRTGAHAALGIIRAHNRNPAIVQRVVAAVHHIIGGSRRAGRGRRRPDHLRVLPRESTRQPSAR